MKYYVIAVPVIAAIALGSYFAGPTNSVTVVQKKHTKLFYDRIPQDPNTTTPEYRAGQMTIEGPKPAPVEPVEVYEPVPLATKCKMPRRVRWQGECWLPSIPLGAMNGCEPWSTRDMRTVWPARCRRGCGR